MGKSTVSEVFKKFNGVVIGADLILFNGVVRQPTSRKAVRSHLNYLYIEVVVQYVGLLVLTRGEDVARDFAQRNASMVRILLDRVNRHRRLVDFGH